MALCTPATRELDRCGVAYQVHVHIGPVASLEQAAAERGLLPGQIVRSLVFRLEGQAFVMVLMPGTRQVSWPRLRRHLGLSRITTATPEQVLAATGYPPGAVTPFGLPGPMRFIADRAILEYDILSIGAGAPNAGLVLARQDLMAALEPEIVDLSD